MLHSSDNIFKYNINWKKERSEYQIKMFLKDSSSPLHLYELKKKLKVNRDQRFDSVPSRFWHGAKERKRRQECVLQAATRPPAVTFSETNCQSNRTIRTEPCSEDMRGYRGIKYTLFIFCYFFWVSQNRLGSQVDLRSSVLLRFYRTRPDPPHRMRTFSCRIKETKLLEEVEFQSGWDLSCGKCSSSSVSSSWVNQMFVLNWTVWLSAVCTKI